MSSLTNKNYAPPHSFFSAFSEKDSACEKVGSVQLNLSRTVSNCQRELVPCREDKQGSTHYELKYCVKASKYYGIWTEKDKFG